MVASGGSDAPVSDQAAVAVASISSDPADTVAREDVVGKKRRTRPESATPGSDSSSSSATTATVVAAAAVSPSPAAVAAGHLLAASRHDAPAAEAGGSETDSDAPASARAAALARSAADAAASAAPGADVNAFVVDSAAQAVTPVTGEGAEPSAPATSGNGKNGASIPTAPAPAADANANAGGANGTPQRMQLFDSKRMARVSFNSWFDFDSYFEMYMQETFQPFRMRSSCSVEAYRRNQQKVMMNNKTSRGRRTEFPDEAIHHHRIYMCTHAMKARCRGATTRPGQKYRGIGCIAKINVKITPADNDSKYMVIVTDQVVTHNHPVSREIYEAYPDVLLKMMRRSQLSQSMLGRPPLPKFETPSQMHKYERAMNALHTVAEQMARLGDEDYEQQLVQLQRIYSTSVGDQQNSSSV